MSKIYSFKMKDIFGKEVDFQKYKNKVLMIVNVASRCGNTKQYSQLQELFDKYKNNNFVVLGFPCNQFFMEEPGNDEEIYNFCTSKYNVTFDMFSKVKVNGPESCELYNFLKESIKWTNRAKNVKWNFEKFLVDKKGIVRYRISNKDDPLMHEDKIKELINE